MKVAIVHDWLVINAGAEKVLRAMIDLYPNADIFSLVDFLDKQEREEVLCGKFAQTSFLQNFPFAKKYFRKYLPLFPMAIKSLDVSQYDLVISSSWAVAKGVITHENQTHISYFQARNMKYIWEEKELYFNGFKKILEPLFLNYLRRFDLESAKNADYIIVNSNFVQEWVMQKYKRTSKVIYPPVDTEGFTLDMVKKDFYISVARFVPYKKIKLIVESFNEMPDRKLVIVGDGDEFTDIDRLKKANIELVGFKNSKELVPYMQKAKAFVYAAVEDFGIVPIEALSCGTPVIALNYGGTAETVVDGVNGIHFNEQNVYNICRAIERFEKYTFNPIEVRETSFKYTHFKEDFKKFVDKKCENF